MKNIKISITYKIQIAILINVLLAIIIGQYFVNELMGLTDILAIIINIIINFTIAIIYGYFISKTLTKPLKQIASSITEMSSASANTTQTATIKSNDEIAELSLALNMFIRKQNNVMMQIIDTTNKLSNSVPELSKIEQEIGLYLNKQLNLTSAVVLSIENLSKATSKVANKSLNVKEFVSGAKNSASNGNNEVTKVISAMYETSDQIATSFNSIEELKESSGKINSITETISDIAKQINLLALNAAIEAARAGDVGRGFAIVADEVRTLSIRTGNAIAGVNDITQEITGKTKLVAEKMTQTILKSKTSISLAEKADHTLDIIQNESNQVLSLIEEISKDSRAQEETMMSVDKNIKLIESMAIESSNKVNYITNLIKTLEKQVCSLNKITSNIYKSP